MDHEFIEQMLHDPTSSTRSDQLQRITMTYDWDGGAGDGAKMNDKVNAALREALMANHAVGLLAVPMMSRSPLRGSVTTSFTHWAIAWKNFRRSPV